MSDVKIMRLSTGEDIIAKIIDKSVETTKLKQPFVIYHINKDQVNLYN